MPTGFHVAFVLGAGLLPGNGAAQDFPVTIQHAFGETVIEEKPDRVASVAWANHEVPLALGIMPVGFAAAGWGDDDGDGLLPWVAERIEELGGEVPVLFDEGDGIDFEAVASTAPDVILAAYSGLSQADYDTLSRIAPVVAYPDAAWTTNWCDMIRLNSAALGMRDEGEALVANLEARLEAAVEAHPEIVGKTAMFVTHLDMRDLSTIGFYSDEEQRVRFLEDLGMEIPTAVREAGEADRYSGRVSAERVDLFDDVDVVVTYGDAEKLDLLKQNPLVARFPAIANDAVIVLGNDALGTAANPTPLSINYVLEDYVDLLSEAARKSE